MRAGVGVLAVTVLVALAGCGSGGSGGSGGGTKDAPGVRADSSEMCAAVARTRFGQDDPHGDAAADRPDRASKLRIGAAFVLLPRFSPGRYAGLSPVMAALNQDVADSRYPAGVVDRQRVLSVCRTLGLPSSDGSGTAGDARSACSLLARTPFPLDVRQQSQLFDRYFGALELVESAQDDPRYAGFRAPYRALPPGDATTEPANTFAPACRQLGLAT